MLMHAERDIVLANPPVRHVVLYLNECTCCQGRIKAQAN